MTTLKKSPTIFNNPERCTDSMSLPGHWRAPRARLAQRLWQHRHAVLFAGVVVSVGLIAGCKKAPPPPPPPPPPPRAKPAPEPLDVASLLQTMQVDPRVEFASSQAPVSQSLAKASISLADAFAKGDDEALRKLLDKSQSGVLDSLLASEQWYDATEPIEAVRVVSIDASSRLNPDPQTTKLAIAIQDPGGAYVLGWSGRKVFDDWLFTATPTDATERRSVKAFDGYTTQSTSLSSNNLGIEDMDQFAADNAELQQLLVKAMKGPSNLTLEELLRLKELIAALDVAPPGVFEMIEEEIAKRKEHPTSEGANNNGDSADQPERPSRRKNTPSGPVDVPG